MLSPSSDTAFALHPFSVLNQHLNNLCHEDGLVRLGHFAIVQYVCATHMPKVAFCPVLDCDIAQMIESSTILTCAFMPAYPMISIFLLTTDCKLYAFMLIDYSQGSRQLLRQLLVC